MRACLRSALERPRNKWQYEQAELPELAAAYAFGLAKQPCLSSTATNEHRLHGAVYVFLGV